MPKTISRFNLGDKVRVCSGVSDPDYDDLTIGGWAGTIAEVQNGTPPTLRVRWSRQTLKKQSSIYRKRCERDGFDSNEMRLVEGDLEPDIGGPITIERPNNVVTRPLSMNDQDDRIRGSLHNPRKRTLSRWNQVRFEPNSHQLLNDFF